MRDTLDFLIIGQQKCGTTSLFRYLRTHPAVFMPERKEEPFFSHEYPDTRYRTWTEYMSAVFRDAPRTAAWGKVTPQYMAGSLLGEYAQDNLAPGVSPAHLIPERIRATIPDVRLVAILRDPVVRAVSAYRMEVTMSRERRGFDEAIDQLLKPEALQAARVAPATTNSYVVRGEYGRILQGYYDVFPREQILVVFTEDLERRPQAVIRSVLAHIGVDPSFMPPNLGVHYYALSRQGRAPWLTSANSSQILTMLPALELRSAQNRGLRVGWHLIPAPLRRQILNNYWQLGRLGYRIAVWNASGQPRPPVASPCSSETRQRLEEHYAEDRRHLSELLGRTDLRAGDAMSGPA